jgi:hypothetical protein
MASCKMLTQLLRNDHIAYTIRPVLNFDEVCHNDNITMLLYAILCDAILCYTILCYTILCYVTLRYAFVCYTMLCYTTLCFYMLYV